MEKNHFALMLKTILPSLPRAVMALILSMCVFGAQWDCSVIEWSNIHPSLSLKSPVDCNSRKRRKFQMYSRYSWTDRKMLPPRLGLFRGMYGATGMDWNRLFTSKECTDVWLTCLEKSGKTTNFWDLYRWCQGNFRDFGETRIYVMGKNLVMENCPKTFLKTA